MPDCPGKNKPEGFRGFISRQTPVKHCDGQKIKLPCNKRKGREKGKQSKRAEISKN